jgi:hypothetical protein
MADIGLAMQRALDKTENMKARADAVQELEAAGTFDDLTQLGSGEDDIDRQLRQLSTGSEVDSELAKMKAELGAGSSPSAGELGAGSSTGSTRSSEGPSWCSATCTRSNEGPAWCSPGSLGPVRTGAFCSSASAKLSDTSRSTCESGVSRAVHIAESSSEEASFCPRSTSDR